MAQRIPLVWQGNRIQQLKAGDSFLTGLSPGRRNPVLNGNFDIWQTGTSFVCTGAGKTFVSDMWNYQFSLGGVTASQEATILPTVTQSNAFSLYSQKLACTSTRTTGSADYAVLGTIIEGTLWRMYSQQSLTLTFWVYSNLTGTYCVYLQNGGSDRSFVSEYTINNANTWEKKTVQISASPSAGTWSYTDGTKGLILGFVQAAGSTYQGTAGSWQSSNIIGTSNQVNWMASTSNVFYLSQVQLERGDTASPFENVPNGLFVCQRYYYKSFPNTTAPVQNVGSTTGAAAYRAGGTGGSVSESQVVQFPNPMAATPTMTYYNPSAANSNWRNVTGSSDSGTSSTGMASTRGCTISDSGAVGVSIGNLLAIHFTADARL